MSLSAARTGDLPAITDIAGTRKGALILWLERVLAGCLFLLAFCAPHSIAGTQIAWGVGLLAWTVRVALRPRPRLHRTPVDYALLGFFILTFFSALASYDPDVSIGKMRAASLFTIVYLVAQNVTTKRMLRLLAFTLVASCMINVVYTFGERIVGRGVEVTKLTADSPLRAAGVNEGDTLLKVNGASLSSPTELARALAADGAPVRLRVYRLEWQFNADVPREQLLRARRRKRNSASQVGRAGATSERRAFTATTRPMPKSCNSSARSPSACSSRAEENGRGRARCLRQGSRVCQSPCC
jgi:hypothetical protein